MFKRLSIFFLLVIVSITSTAFAGNIPENIMINPQKGLFIGKIINTSDKEFTIEPKTIMMGKIKNKQIKINKFDKYYGTTEIPKKNDYIVARLLDINKIDEFWIFKATSNNYKTLKLICNPSYDMVLRYQKYINNGNYFEAQKKLDAKLNALPTSTKDLPKTKNTPSIQNKSKISKPQYIMISLLIFFMLGMCIYSSHNKLK